MTVTVKLDAEFEQQLRQRAAASGTSTSEVIRQALRAFLAMPSQAAAPSAHALGAELFGRFRGEPTLAQDRKRVLGEIWSDKRRA